MPRSSRPPLSVEPRLEFVLSLPEIRRLATEEAMEAGVRAQAHGLVRAFKGRERGIEAQVELRGRHTAALALRAGALAARCTCAPPRGTLCAHGVATALEWMARGGPPGSPTAWPGDAKFQKALAAIDRAVRASGGRLWADENDDALRALRDGVWQLFGGRMGSIPWTVSAYACAAVGKGCVPRKGCPMEIELHLVSPTSRNVKTVPAQERAAFAWWVFHEEMEGRSCFEGFGSCDFFRSVTDDNAVFFYESMVRSVGERVLPPRADPWKPESPRQGRVRRMLAAMARHSGDREEEIRILSQGVGSFPGFKAYLQLLLELDRGDEARRLIETALKRFPAARIRQHRHMLAALRPPATPGEAFEKAWAQLVNRPDGLEVWRAWLEARTAGVEPEYFARAHQLLHSAESLKRQGTARWGVSSARLALAFFSGDMLPLEETWGLNRSDPRFWETVEHTLQHFEGYHTLVIVPSILGLGLNIAPGAAHRILYRMLEELFKELHFSSPPAWLIDWRNEFLQKYAEHVRFADAIRERIPESAT